MAYTATRTQGEERVRINEKDTKAVKRLKRKAAELIDLIDTISSANTGGDVRRNCASAMTAFEEGVMWATKAMTSSHASVPEPEDDEDETEAEGDVSQAAQTVDAGAGVRGSGSVKTRDELDSMTKDELVNYADDNDIEVQHNWLKDEIVKAILAGQKQKAKTPA
jgi:hypothetical protein